MKILLISIFKKLYFKLIGVKYLTKRSKLTLSNSGSLFYSQQNQDIIALELIRNTFNDDKIIKIIDIGANHPINFNNTLLF
jgi:hypothetical protein